MTLADFVNCDIRVSEDRITVTDPRMAVLFTMAAVLVGLGLMLQWRRHRDCPKCGSRVRERTEELGPGLYCENDICGWALVNGIEFSKIKCDVCARTLADEDTETTTSWLSKQRDGTLACGSGCS